ncbi:MAG: hydrolase family protein [Eubacterium sp.]|jgi:lysophospholipase L1-like esterase|nr:hydrolase family protein [Eubacterium sp.]
MYNIASMVAAWKEDRRNSFRIVAFGSSNTELFLHSEGRHNWVDWLNITLRQHIGRNVSVINQGVCGDTTEELLDRFERDVLPLSPRIVLITIGGNDASRGFAFEHYYNNLKIICTKCLQNSFLPILQTYYCPFFEESPEGFKDSFESFVAANRALSKEMELPLIDQYSHFEPLYSNKRQLYRGMMRDMLHLNYYGNAVMGTIAARFFELPDPDLPEDIRKEVMLYLEEIMQ